ncbi:HAD family hydrolase [Halovivax sp.]|uniref:HAD family hydrolase n=1 Tax=Halovivax sp. TaxID=1935978 RepID=UPI0025BE7A10|nr:HAD family hydrolase [Halovivax sp.]
MIRAVVFDLDYTLAVPERDRTTILEEAAAAADAPALSREAYLEAHRRNLTRETREPIFEELLDEHGADVDPAAVAAAYRESIAEALAPLPGVEGMLDDLRRHYRVGLLTNGPVRAQREKLETLGWERAFDAALVTGELEAGKPDRRAFRAILDELGVDPGDAVYVGDEIEADVRGATETGMRVVQVLRPETAPDERAVAHVSQFELAATLPATLAELDEA